MGFHNSVKRAAWSVRAGALVVVLAFGLPLFRGLDHRDMHNDEASYSYGVQRILETGEWLTVRGTPTNMEFLEKPPLKFWLVAGGMKLGLLPRTDVGMRWLDALFGTAGFLYVYLIGVRIRGPWAGLAAAMVLFAFEPLIMDHGLRSNNMEAALVLAYCAGLFHFLAWTEAPPGAARRAHAMAAALAFVLGFMTKFIVIIFLPFAALCVWLTHPRRRELFVRARVTDWLWPALAATALIAPWFLYQTWRVGADFWKIILGQQVLERMSTGLDATHIEPASFYVTEIWRVLSASKTSWLVAAGLAAAVVDALRRDGTYGRLLVAWSIVPLAAISISHSKIIHYTYPFIPPLALAAGALLVDTVRWLTARLAPEIVTKLRGSAKRQILFAAGALALVLGGVTFATGRLVWHLPTGGVISNGSVLRPLIAGGLLMWLAVRNARVWLLAPALLFIVPVVPTSSYLQVLEHIGVVYRPLAAVNACLRDLRAGGAPIPVATDLANGYPPTHAYYYYLREFGPYQPVEGDAATDAALVARVTATPPAMVIFKRNDYWAWRDRVGSALPALPAVVAEDNWVLALPGAAGACAAPAVRAGAEGTEKQ